MIRFKSDIKNLAIEGLQKGIDEYKEGAEYSPIDDLQKELKCCGIHGANDWDTKFNGTSYPNSCCQDAPAGAHCSLNDPSLFSDPCLSKFEELFKKVASALAGVGITVAVIQLTAVLSTCCLARAFRREYEVV